MKVGQHEVQEQHYTVLECPACETERKAYHLGTASDGRVGWVCGVCTAEILEDPETGELQRASEVSDSE
ncbi:hypothetical protein Htur_5071 (plasmid) [Haloterrigena turkmenica DSM 5511]|uniref:Uncharacterized protein n=1 Tax=Haloterrigena turkmenica (strain ATCC 51198 / DSM 5511 / JCM 9101 / NCIMB 13204 / VKM B-1734 / 4k) TaxID=543526 RepID=D2S3L1_HALTV|nr:hypothetical protein [Haloterrigena turkmenica]ADB63958.1 hypothetical protein Htur_5071 [Haloterrigena turkmenica DSM 5511]